MVSRKHTLTLSNMLVDQLAKVQREEMRGSLSGIERANLQPPLKMPISSIKSVANV